MIKLITGPKGSGKTKLLIDTANEEVKKARGNSIYIDRHNTQMLRIDYRIRFINIRDYRINNPLNFYGFICGIVASNYDIERIYIDGLYYITGTEVEEMEEFFKKLEELDLRYNISFILTVSRCKDDLPEFMKKYIIIEY